MRNVKATRYVTPLREGGSLPAIVEADDDGLYVLKFRGAGQGSKALIAELIAGEIGRALGLLVPDIVFIELDPELARTEGDPEIQELIRRSAGLNLALDYLPGSVMFNHAADKIDNNLASSIVWFDAFISNIDRTIRNTNMLLWHRRFYLIDHGASLYFHHRWNDYIEKSKDPFPFIKDHVLLNSASSLEKADKELSRKISKELIKNIVNQIPDIWLSGDSAFGSPGEYRNAYTDYLLNRLKHRHFFIEEAIRAKSLL
ncbi:MAG TPA: HipA family kinase [Ignavibacteriaceae bacterium]|nr:HipA family kinase [Ignavibacteriaceae bacterium]